MKKTRVAVASVLPLVAAAALWAATGKEREGEPEYRFATIERGNLHAAVSATGTLGAVTTVQVGTQVSGQIAAIYVDFNDRVRRGQLLARIDPTLAEQSVREAEAGIARNRAELERAQLDFDRNLKLHESKVVTAAELSNVRYQLEVAQANVRSAQVAVDRARRNLGYTEIHAPIDGMVVERNVDVGQTVAASLSAPQLFLIAQDLAEMQILAAVDESDIGLIETGQPVEFTVQAYPDERFTGTVKQVRLQSTTQENVVSYTAVVSVRNDSGKLLPGMTATVDFVTGAATAALLVPNAALRFRPTEEMLAAIGGQSNTVPVGAAGSGTGTAAPPAGARNGRQGGAARLWYLKDGKLAVARVRTGITDGQKTVIEGEGLTEGMQVIAGTTQGVPVAGGAPANPLGGQPQQTRGMPRPGGF